jgi:ribosome-binding protein aMBF1 (putative translation factor)
MQSFKDFKAEVLKDPEVKKAYDDLEEEYRLEKQLIELRNKIGLTQKKLAEKMGTKQPAIARFEKKLANPTVKFLSKIARAMDLNLIIRFEEKSLS